MASKMHCLCCVQKYISSCANFDIDILRGLGIRGVQILGYLIETDVWGPTT